VEDTGREGVHSLLVPVKVVFMATTLVVMKQCKNGCFKLTESISKLQQEM
jgi:hypothetical protein